MGTEQRAFRVCLNTKYSIPMSEAQGSCAGTILCMLLAGFQATSKSMRVYDWTLVRKFLCERFIAIQQQPDITCPYAVYVKRPFQIQCNAARFYIGCQICRQVSAAVYDQLQLR